MERKLSSSTRILVIDDEAGMREGCRRALVPYGHKVDTAADLNTARNLMLDEHYDLYLIDVMLPDGSGLNLIEPILERDPQAICIIITGFGSIEMAVDAVRRGAYDFLAKPFTSDELIVTVNQGIERRNLSRLAAQADELARAKEELEKLDEVKSQLMLKVAHELRSPVAAVQSYINLILAGYVEQREMQPTLKRVQERLQEMLDMISDLLDLARLKQARDQLGAEACPQDMAHILQEVCELLREQAHEKKQSFEVDVLDHPIIVADREHLKQIWMNLISNAIKYTPVGGRIALRLQADKDSLLGVVEDSGIGIADKDMAHLFQEFFRTDQAKESGEIGTGLGLSIVKQIIDSYDGEIKATSKLGQGTRFTFVLPLRPVMGEADSGDSTQEGARSDRSFESTETHHRPAYPMTHTRAFTLGSDSSEGPEYH